MGTYPAGAGINLTPTTSQPRSCDLPRRRGDKPTTMTHTNHALHLPRRRGDKPKPLDLAQIGLTKEPTPQARG